MRRERALVYHRACMPQDVSSGGNTLREWRIARHLTQRDVAARVGVGDQAISNLECGRCPPTLRTAVLIEKLTGIEPSEWLAPDDAELRRAG